MNQMIPLVERIPTAPQSPTDALVHMIERAARDPSVDLDKLRQLIELRNEVEARAAERDFDIAMNAAQSEMRPIAADSNNPQTRSRYASYFALDKALRPIYAKHGFTLSFNTGEGAPDQYVRVLCRVSRGGHSRDYHVDMPADGKGAKGGDVMTKTHAVGSALSYGSRYLLKMIFNVAIGEDDDDGNAAGNGSDKIDEQQAEWLKTCIVESGADLPRFLKYMKVERVEDIPVRNYPQAVDMLNRKKAEATKAVS